MRAPLIAMVLSSVSAAVCAQSANETVTGLESCFQSARRADSICSSPENDAAQRLDCLQKARTAQLECLQRVPQATSVGSAPAEKPAATAALAMPAATASRDLPTAAVLPEKPAAVAPDRPARAVESPSKPADADWIVSETTSPVDYAPLTTAAIRLPFTLKHAPTTLAMRCRGRRTDLLVRTEGTWRVSRAGEVQVDYQIDDQPLVRLPWNTSADGKTASYGNDAVGFLQSLPEGARLKINVLDRAGSGREATFRLDGLDAVRKRIAVPCKWATAADKISPGRR
jgi:Type VI secretion system VasI, EvfG, VC_A0118